MKSESHIEYVDSRQRCISILINFVVLKGGGRGVVDSIRIVADRAGLWDCYSTRPTNRNQKMLVLPCGDLASGWLIGVAELSGNLERS